MMVLNWRPKYTMIKAIEWTGKNQEAIKEFGANVILDTLVIGDYIMQDEKGRFHAYPREVFLAKWERHLIWEDNL